MKIKTYIVDAFTSEPFKGNGAGVCIVEDRLDEEVMLSIAKELGLSETAFVNNTSEGHFAIRYFSPKMEIPLCGHATLASAKVLFDENKIEHIQFITGQGLQLHIKRSGDGIAMEFPVYDTEPASVPEELVRALGLHHYHNAEFNREFKILLLEIKDSELLSRLRPDFAALLRSHKNIHGVCVTALSNKNEFDFESRYFWPWSGTNEDPVTGGTHTFLAKYWSKRLGKSKMRSFQCSERTGWMEVELVENNKMIITSSACIVMEGILQLEQ